ncbi:MAG: EF2563 family selenium-dependent molybdenum hydroxylase system protein [Chloroflexi bacterium]|nr:EF2563 family selenium-dependent molybdenum hydroxylase system protein [Chloroflexota bacterium]MBI3169740.1 EF2563 family selenium-dependent molybdenum hydroxylase system protein [Chloroflexota bacterium]
MNPLILIRGGGDLASGVALRLHRVGFQVAILELAKPLAVRRTVSFSEAVYEGTQTVEGVVARLVSADQFQVALEAGEIPVLIDPDANVLNNQFITSPKSTFVVDARLMKTEPEPLPINIALHIGLGPGFTAGADCHAVIETLRGHALGRVYWDGQTAPDSRQPDGDMRRVLRAPTSGKLESFKAIGDLCKEGEVIAKIDGKDILSPFDGILRGLIHPKVQVTEGMKIGDVDARNDSSMVHLVSDKSLAVAGGVLEAVYVKLREME